MWLKQVLFHLIVLWTSFLGCYSDAQNILPNNDGITANITRNTDKNILTFSPPSIDGLKQGTNQTVYFNFSGDGNTLNAAVQVSSADDSIAKVVSVKNLKPQQTLDGNSTSDNHQKQEVSNSTHFQYSLIVHGEFMGRTHLKFMVPQRLYPNEKNTSKYNISINNNSAPIKVDTQDGDQKWREIADVYDVTVVRTESWEDYLFIGVVTFVVLCANVFMGFKIDLEVVKEVLKKPFAPGIGFVCQFIVMPLAAYGIVRLLKLEGGQALGFFAAGCAPGGGASNIYTYILGGDVSLSVTMTLVSTLASFGMIPLWLYTLGMQLIDEKYDISIPFSSIFFSLLGITCPVGIGMLIKRKKPDLVVKLVKYLKPVFIILVIFLFTFGIWVNRYIFRLFTPKILLAGCLLPYTGFLVSGIAATACRQPLFRIITIIIETGIQNTGIPIILLRFSLPQPESDLSLISPVVVSVFTPIPLWLAFFTKEIYRRWCKKKDASKEDFGFHRVMTDSETTPEEDRLSLETAVTFDKTSEDSNSKNGDQG